VIVTLGLHFPALRYEFKSAYRFPRRLSSSCFVHRLHILSIISDFRLSFVLRLLRFPRRRIRSALLHSTSTTLRATFPTFPIFRVSSRYVVRQSRLSHLVPPVVKSHRAIVGPFPLSLRTFIVDYLTYYTLRRPSQFLSFGCWFVVCWLSLGPFQALRLSLRHSDHLLVFTGVSAHHRVLRSSHKCPIVSPSNSDDDADWSLPPPEKAFSSMFTVEVANSLITTTTLLPYSFT
jgi:hypothetical protein